MTTMTALAMAMAMAAATTTPAPTGIIEPTLGLGPGALVPFGLPSQVLGAGLGSEAGLGVMVRVGDDGAPHHLELRGQLVAPMLLVVPGQVVFNPENALVLALPAVTIGGGTRVWQHDDVDVGVGGHAGVGVVLEPSGDFVDLAVAPAAGLHARVSWQTPLGPTLTLRAHGRAHFTSRRVTPVAGLLLEVGFPIALR
jgi:hypothetical protein